MEENINFINKIKISVLNIGRYKELLRLSFSKALIYSILLSILVGVVTGIAQFTAINLVQKASRTALTDDKFSFEMKDGILNFNESPIIKEKGKLILLIDTNKSLEDEESVRKIIIHKDISTVIFKDGISIRNNDQKVTYNYKELPLPQNFDNELIIKALDAMKPLKYIVFIVNIFLVYLTFLFYAFIISLGGSIINKTQGINLSYGDIFKLSLYAMTLPTLIKLIYPIGPLSILVSGFYLMIAISKIKLEANI